MHWCGLMERKMRHRFKNIFCQTDVKNEAFYEKIDWDRKENNDGWEFGGDWEHQVQQSKFI